MSVKKRYLVTGACGHLGSTIVRMLQKERAEVRGLLAPGEKAENTGNVRYISGDVRRIETLEKLFAGGKGKQTVVIHTAGIVDIADQVSAEIYDVNVNGTKNIIALCKKYKVSRLVYVSSVHAIPEADKLSVIAETKEFSPDTVVGGYAKTKAEATKEVLKAAEEGLDAVVVLPSGILGPYDRTGNHLVQLIKDYVRGALPACVRGGYDFVDVRDVARGCLLAAEKGRSGECYILSNRHYEIRELLKMAGTFVRTKKIPVLPAWMARVAEPFIGIDAKRKKRRPLYTKYSLHVLNSADRFSHEKATSELGYRTRDMKTTIRDTVRWLKAQRAEQH